MGQRIFYLSRTRVGSGKSTQRKRHCLASSNAPSKNFIATIRTRRRGRVRTVTAPRRRASQRAGLAAMAPSSAAPSFATTAGRPDPAALAQGAPLPRHRRRRPLRRKVRNICNFPARATDWSCLARSRWCGNTREPARRRHHAHDQFFVRNNGLIPDHAEGCRQLKLTSTARSQKLEFTLGELKSKIQP